MSNKCHENDIDLTDSNDYPKDSAHQFDEIDEKHSLKDEELNAADEKTDSEAEAEEDFSMENSIDVDDSNIKDFRPIQARDIEKIQYITANLGNLKSNDGPIKVSLFENSETTRLKNADELEFKLIESFKRKRILLLGGSGDEHSEIFSHQIARLLEIKDREKNIRRLDLSFYTENPPIVQTISPKRKSSDNKVVQDALVFVDAISESGYEFTGSLLKSTAGFMDQYSSKLIDNKLYMICLISAGLIEDWIKSGKTINSLYCIIPGRKYETESSENEPEISREVERLLDSDNETDGRIVRIILFVVSFFSNLTTNDFNDLVDKWLRNEPGATIESADKNDSENKILTKTSLLEIWKSKSRFFTEHCFLSQKKDEQGKRVVGFYNESYANVIRKRLEKYYWAFLDEKISEILQMRLIFHPSDHIASQSALILAEYLPGNEENFIDWLLWVFNILNDEENRAESLRQILGIRDLDGDVEETGKKYFYYKRLAKLFRVILRNSSLKTTVSNIMERLIQDGCYQSALILVKRLQYDPNFDESYWLRQLLERGDDKTKREIKKYLFNNIINIGVKDAFNKLNEWLPQENSPSGNYSQMNRAALELLIKYYSYQINIFDEKLYELEPTRFPLFIFENKSVADEQLELLVKYLLHPINLKLRFDGMPYIYFAALLLERWSRILCKNNLWTKDSPSPNGTISNKEILNLLLEKVVRLSDEEEQEQIKNVWIGLMNIHDAIYHHNSDWDVREKAVCEREFMTNLIELFSDKQWAAR